MKTKLLLGLLLFSTLCFAERKTVSSVVTVNGDTVTFDNVVGGMTVSIGEVMTGAPSTVSVVVQGCKIGAICATLDTNTSVGNAIRNITVTTVYDYFLATAAWTGGTSVSIGFNYTTTTARTGGGGGGGGAVNSVFGRAGDVVASTNDYSFAQIGSKPTTVGGYGITDAVPTARTVNGHALSANVTVTASDVGNGTAQWNANLLNSVSLAGLVTGLVKNTTGTGVPSIATGADIDALFTGAGKCYLFKGTTPGTNDGCDNPSAGSSVELQTSGVDNASQSLINFIASTSNSVGLTVTPSNSTNTEKFEVTGNSYTGNAATATKWATARNLAGNSTDGSANVSFANGFWVKGTTDGGLSNAFFMGSLGTGLVKNTTSTGVPSIAAASDVVSLLQGLTGCNTATFVFTPQASDCVAPSGGGSGTVNSGTQFAFAYYATASTAVSSGPTPPTANGQYTCGYTVVAGVAVAPTCPLVGFKGRAVTGATATDTILYSDAGFPVNYQGSVAVAVTLPTATTLGNTGFGSVFVNTTSGSSTAVTVTPTTWTVNGSATLVIAQGQSCKVYADASGTNWDADCHDLPLVAGSNITITPGQFGPTVASTGSSGLSGMTAGQVPIAATGTTVTSSKVLAGSGTGVTTGPTTTTNTDLASFSGTGGQVQDSGIASGNVSTAASAAGAANQVALSNAADKTLKYATADSTMTHALMATAGAPAFRALAAGDMPTAIPIGNVGSAGLSGTAPVGISAAGAISCATCNTTAAVATPPFDKSATGLSNPTADATFTEPNTSTTGTTLNGTAPASVSTATGTNGSSVFNVTAPTGGADSNATGTAGIGGSPSITAGAGGAGTGTNSVGGAGGSVTLTAGNGGVSLGTGVNANGGNIVVVPGTAGSGGSGTAGKAGAFQVGSSAPSPVIGTSGGSMFGCGTAPTGISANGTIYCNASNFPDLLSGTTDLGAAVAEASIIGANVIPKAVGTNPQLAASSISDGATAGLTSTANMLKGGNTVRLTANATAITATTPGTIVLTLGALPVSTNFSFRCAILYNQQTAAVAGTGFAIQGATNAPTRLDAWGQMYTSNAGVSAGGSVQNLTTTTATSVVTGTPSAITTVFQAIIDGSVQVGASATTLNLLAFTGNASDSITIQAGSYCSIHP